MNEKALICPEPHYKSKLLSLELGNLSVFQTSIPLSPPTDLTNICQQTSKVAEEKLKRQHGHVCLHLLKQPEE